MTNELFYNQVNNLIENNGVPIVIGAPFFN